LVVHRSLVHLIEGGTKKKPAQDLAEVSLHISDTERRAMLAERDASDRYKVAYMGRHVGNTFAGTINSLNEYGLFVMLPDNGITGFIPVRNLPGDFFTYDKRHACFKGQRSKQIYQIGQALMVRVQTANTLTSSLIFELSEGVRPPDVPLRPHKPGHGHKPRHKPKPKGKHKHRR
jgi:ribonuclease R